MTQQNVAPTECLLAIWARYMLSAIGRSMRELMSMEMAWTRKLQSALRTLKGALQKGISIKRYLARSLTRGRTVEFGSAITI
jgi:hypothetical protein